MPQSVLVVGRTTVRWRNSILAVLNSIIGTHSGNTAGAKERRDKSRWGKRNPLPLTKGSLGHPPTSLLILFSSLASDSKSTRTHPPAPEWVSNPSAASRLTK